MEMAANDSSDSDSGTGMQVQLQRAASAAKPPAADAADLPNAPHLPDASGAVAASAAVPAIAAAADAALPLVNVEPKVQNHGHKLVVSLVLPRLLRVMQAIDSCNLQPRQHVHRALMSVDGSGERFWGAHQAYSRKRTVEDLVLQYYYDDVRRLM